MEFCVSGQAITQFANWLEVESGNGPIYLVIKLKIHFFFVNDILCQML